MDQNWASDCWQMHQSLQTLLLYLQHAVVGIIITKNIIDSSRIIPNI